VAWTLIVGDRDESIDKAFTIARKEPDTCEEALLGVAIGEEIECDGLGVLRE
jgi:hypothetical protein